MAAARRAGEDRWPEIKDLVPQNRKTDEGICKAVYKF